MTSTPSTASPLIDDLDFGTLMPTAPFSEEHAIVIDRPIEEVWTALMSVSGDEIKLLRPLFALRGVPARLRGRRPPTPAGDRPVLDLFAEEGFTMLRTDERPADGHAVLIFGAAGKFWSAAHNAPLVFGSPQELIDFDEPGHAKTVARFEAWEERGRTRLVTQTLVDGTDAASGLESRLRSGTARCRVGWCAGHTVSWLFPQHSPVTEGWRAHPGLDRGWLVAEGGRLTTSGDVALAGGTSRPGRLRPRFVARRGWRRSARPSLGPAPTRRTEPSA